VCGNSDTFLGEKKAINIADNKKLQVYKLLHSCSPENVLIGGCVKRVFGKYVNDKD
jgi:hypothetical protein